MLPKSVLYKRVGEVWRDERELSPQVVEREKALAGRVHVDEGVSSLVDRVDAAPLAHRLALELGEREAGLVAAAVVVLATGGEVVEQLVFGYLVAEEEEPAGLGVVFAHESRVACCARDARQVVERLGDEAARESLVVVSAGRATGRGAHLMEHSDEQTDRKN